MAKRYKTGQLVRGKLFLWLDTRHSSQSKCQIKYHLTVYCMHLKHVYVQQFIASHTSYIPSHGVTYNTYYGTCHKKLYEIHGLSASEIRSFSAASPRISTESSKGVRGIVRGCPRNRERVSAKSWKGVRGIVNGCPRNRQRESADL